MARPSVERAPNANFRTERPRAGDYELSGDQLQTDPRWKASGLGIPDGREGRQQRVRETAGGSTKSSTGSQNAAATALVPSGRTAALGVIQWMHRS
jgi:hypothetical protein